MKKKNNLIQVLCPYGKWQHSKGLQIVDKESALKMLKNFPSVFMQKFFKKVPIYVGHPDESTKKPALKKHIVGYVEKIIALDDGIAALCTYDDIHYEKIIKKELQSMSPRWKTLALDNGNFMPVELISVGLTNDPNIESSGEILSPSKLISQQKKLREKELYEKSLEEELKKSIKKSTSCTKSISKIKNIQESLVESISKKLISSALNKGAISANECHEWTKNFKEKFDETKKKLIQTSAKSEGLSTKEIVKLTKQKMQEKDLSWDCAFAEIKKENYL